MAVREYIVAVKSVFFLLAGQRWDHFLMVVSASYIRRECQLIISIQSVTLPSHPGKQPTDGEAFVA